MNNEKDNFNKASNAIALKYEMGEDDAPKIIAKGKGEIAAQIIKIAKENGIEIKKDSNLTEILDALEIDDFIPLEAYTAVAEILRAIYKKQGR